MKQKKKQKKTTNDNIFVRRDYVSDNRLQKFRIVTALYLRDEIRQNSENVKVTEQMWQQLFPPQTDFLFFFKWSGPSE